MTDDRMRPAGEPQAICKAAGDDPNRKLIDMGWNSINARVFGARNAYGRTSDEERLYRYIQYVGRKFTPVFGLSDCDYWYSEAMKQGDRDTVTAWEWFIDQLNAGRDILAPPEPA